MLKEIVRTLKQQLQWQLTPIGEKDAKLHRILSLADYLPDVKGLITQAQDKDEVEIKFSSDLIGTRTLASFETVMHGECAGKKSPLINPLADDLESFLSVAHELRHHWQHHILDIPTDQLLIKKRTPSMGLIITRMQETDAYAFEDDVRLRLSAAMIAAQFPQGNIHISHDREAHMREFFLSKLKRMPHYNLKELQTAHNLHTHFNAKKDRFIRLNNIDDISLDKLRAFTLAGTQKGSADYLADISMASLHVALLRPVEPFVHKTFKLMDTFCLAGKNSDERMQKEYRMKVQQNINRLVS